MREEESLDNIKQYYVKCKNEDGKYNAIQNIYGCISIGQAIIFCHVSIHVSLNGKNNSLMQWLSLPYPTV